MNGVGYGALVGKVGENGTPFYVGAGPGFSIPGVSETGGRLYLAVNDLLVDAAIADNSGGYTVTIEAPVARLMFLFTAPSGRRPSRRAGRLRAVRSSCAPSHSPISTARGGRDEGCHGLMQESRRAFSTIEVSADEDLLVRVATEARGSGRWTPRMVGPAERLQVRVLSSVGGSRYRAWGG
jgi:hypothetical protein